MDNLIKKYTEKCRRFDFNQTGTFFSDNGDIIKSWQTFTLLSTGIKKRLLNLSFKCPSDDRGNQILSRASFRLLKEWNDNGIYEKINKYKDEYDFTKAILLEKKIRAPRSDDPTIEILI